MVFIDEFEREGAERDALLSFPAVRFEAPARKRRRCNDSSRRRVPAADEGGVDIRIALCTRLVVAVASGGAAAPPPALPEHLLPRSMYATTCCVDDFLRRPGVAAALRHPGVVASLGGFGCVYDGCLRLSLPRDIYEVFGVPRVKRPHSTLCGVESVVIPLDDVLYDASTRRRAQTDTVADNDGAGGPPRAPSGSVYPATQATLALRSLGEVRVVLAASDEALLPPGVRAGGRPTGTAAGSSGRPRDSEYMRVPVTVAAVDAWAPFSLSAAARDWTGEVLADVTAWVGLVAAGGDAPSPDTFPALPTKAGRTRVHIRQYRGLFPAPAVARFLSEAATGTGGGSGKKSSAKWLVAECCASAAPLAPPWTDVRSTYAPTLPLGAAQHVAIRGGEAVSHLLRSAGDLP